MTNGAKPIISANRALMQTSIPGLESLGRGKVRDIYEADMPDGTKALLIVATDRISAFDVVMATGIPGKGRLLTGLSLWWFDFLKEVTPNHLITADVRKMKDMGIITQADVDANNLAGRTMLCRKARVMPVECVVRGYLAGSGWKDYQRNGKVCGIELPTGLRQCERLPSPIFTPATKAGTGHDENITFERMETLLGFDVASWLRNTSIDLYVKAAEHARQLGVIIADTKFEWGAVGCGEGTIILVDEVLTPDSSRFWPADGYEPGHDQPSFDKQFLRNWLEGLCALGTWDKKPPGPELPQEIVAQTRAKYVEAYQRLTGKGFK